jgi:hypothetical protein
MTDTVPRQGKSGLLVYANSSRQDQTLSERQWGTVREDYSKNGDVWNFFTHDHA